VLHAHALLLRLPLALRLLLLHLHLDDTLELVALELCLLPEAALLFRLLLPPGGVSDSWRTSIRSM